MMTHAPGIIRGEGPEGSIFLPKTENPVREFGSWQAQLLLRRGIGEGLSFEEQADLYDQLERERERYFGSKVLATGAKL